MIPLTMFAASEADFVGIKYYITITSTSWGLRDTGSVNYTVDWGDGNTQASTSNNLSHTYASAGSYVVTVTPTGTYRPYWNNSSQANRVTACEISTDSTWNLGTSLYGAFKDAGYMTTITMDFSATSNVTNFNDVWTFNENLTSIPLIDTSSGTNFAGAWYLCRSLTSLPSLNFSSATNFRLAWYGCNSLTTFPANVFDSTGALSTITFHFAWNGCALTAQSIENILTSLDTNGASSVLSHINGGTNASKTTWSTAANTAYTNLINKGWTISYNS